jgi:hypothetical protein
MVAFCHVGEIITSEGAASRALTFKNWMGNIKGWAYFMSRRQVRFGEFIRGMISLSV